MLIVTLFNLYLFIFFILGKISSLGNEYYEEEKSSKPNDGVSKSRTEKEILPPPPPPPRKNHLDSREKQGPTIARAEEEDIFVGDGVDYNSPEKDAIPSPLLEDMEESPRHKERVSYFPEPAYGPVSPSAAPQEWQELVSFFVPDFVTLFLNAGETCTGKGIK